MTVRLQMIDTTETDTEPERSETQLTSILMMVIPGYFGLNPETLASNPFQNSATAESLEADKITQAAMREFAGMVETLKAEGITVVAVPSREGVVTPDAIFPNNWVSFHPDRVVLYPMLAPNRRQERQLETVELFLADAGIQIADDELDLTNYEDAGVYLEGTGSMVLDRVNRVAFANISPRTSADLLEIWAKEMNYEVVTFEACDRDGKDIYHTNVVMAIGDEFAVICLEAIPNLAERSRVKAALEKLGKEVIEITLDQLYAFCGNLLQAKSNNGEPKIVMSETARKIFTEDQKRRLQKYGKIVPVDITTIETIGGGSARCMLAEVFPARKDGHGNSE